MASGSPMAIVAGACFLLAALAYVRSWRLGTWLAAAGAMILAGALAARGLQAGYWPLTGEYEFALAFALATALAAVIAASKPDRCVPVTQAATMLFAVLSILSAVLCLDKSAFILFL